MRIVFMSKDGEIFETRGLCEEHEKTLNYPPGLHARFFNYKGKEIRNHEWVCDAHYMEIEDSQSAEMIGNILGVNPFEKDSFEKGRYYFDETVINWRILDDLLCPYRDAIKIFEQPKEDKA